LFLAITSSHFSLALAEILIHSFFRACGMVKVAAFRSHTSRGARTARARNVSAPEISNTMTKPVPKDKFKPVLCKQGFMVHGGLLKKPECVELIDREDGSFIKVNKRDNWICQLAAGKSSGGNPLKRTTIIEVLLSGIDSLVGGRWSQKSSGVETLPSTIGKGVVVDIGYDDIDVDLKSSTMGRKTKTGRQTKAGVHRANKHCECVSVYLSSAFGRDDDLPVRVLSCMPSGRSTKGSLAIHTEDLPWVLGQLRAEVLSGGVDYQPDESLMRRPYFSHRDRSWVVRAKPQSGVTQRKTFTVPLFGVDDNGIKMPFTKAAQSEVKHTMYEEAVRWKDQVESGELLV
jgi:hypothetical protein